ncbi:MAG: ATP phosphoribosyltransferase regulatory subunit [Xanthobacteraceae bacterium]
MSSARSTPNAFDARADALLSLFERAGYIRVSPAILQPSEPFLDLSGEDIRKRMYLTTDPQGRELCLRPDITIPVSRHYLSSAVAGRAQGFCYLGPVFRYHRDAAVEFLQAGIESFGRADVTAADAEMLALGLEATAHYGLARPHIRIGDLSLFSALIDALDLAHAWKRRLIKDFNHKTTLALDLERLTITPAHAKPEYQGVLAALAGSDPKAAHALVTDLLSIAGISAVGGRSVGEIADRFLEQAALGAQTSLPQDMRRTIERFLAVSGNPVAAAGELRHLAREHNIALDAALDRFESRTGLLAARGVDVSSVNFSTAFGRGLDYYTGFVFELHATQEPDNDPVVAGGRYDGLLTRLGSATRTPAVGFAVWIERLAGVSPP